MSFNDSVVLEPITSGSSFLPCQESHLEDEGKAWRKAEQGYDGIDKSIMIPFEQLEVTVPELTFLNPRLSRYRQL